MKLTIADFFKNRNLNFFKASVAIHVVLHPSMLLFQDQLLGIWVILSKIFSFPFYISLVNGILLS